MYINKCCCVVILQISIKCKFSFIVITCFTQFHLRLKRKKLKSTFSSTTIHFLFSFFFLNWEPVPAAGHQLGASKLVASQPASQPTVACLPGLGKVWFLQIAVCPSRRSVPLSAFCTSLRSPAFSFIIPFTKNIPGLPTQDAASLSLGPAPEKYSHVYEKIKKMSS